MASPPEQWPLSNSLSQSRTVSLPGRHVRLRTGPVFSESWMDALWHRTCCLNHRLTAFIRWGRYEWIPSGHSLWLQDADQEPRLHAGSDHSSGAWDWREYRSFQRCLWDPAQTSPLRPGKRVGGLAAGLCEKPPTKRAFLGERDQ